MWARSSSASCSSMTRTTSALTISRWPFSAPIWNSASPFVRAQLRRQPVESRCNITPIAEPIARKADGHLGAFERALADAGPRGPTGAMRAAGEELFRIACWINEVFTIVRRAAAKRQNRKPVRSRLRLRAEIARIDRAQPLERRQHTRQSHDG